MWTGSSGHCHAIDNEVWELHRKVMQETHKAKKAIEEVDNAMNNKSSVLVSMRKSMQDFRKTLHKFLGYLKYQSFSY